MVWRSKCTGHLLTNPPAWTNEMDYFLSSWKAERGLRDDDGGIQLQKDRQVASTYVPA